MTPKELHNHCVAACSECPQYGFKRWRFEQKPEGIKYHTLDQVASYWLRDELLWQRGYHECLNPQAKRFFQEIRDAQKNALLDVCARLGESEPAKKSSVVDPDSLHHSSRTVYKWTCS